MIQSGQWVHIPENLSHQFSGYDGEVVAARGESVLVEIYDVTWAADRVTLRLISHLCMFHIHDVEPVPGGRETTYEVLRHAVHKWNTRG